MIRSVHRFKRDTVLLMISKMDFKSVYELFAVEEKKRK